MSLKLKSGDLLVKIPTLTDESNTFYMMLKIPTNYKRVMSNIRVWQRSL